MKFFLYVPGMAFDGDLVKQAGFSLGGSESMGYYIARSLVEQGHHVFLFCNLPQGSAPRLIDGVNYLPIGAPSQQTPFGNVFEQYAMSIPHDVLLAQRAPGLFSKKYASKMNYWWTHDLALKRFQGHMNAQLWNIDKVLTVSNFHKEQAKKVYGLEEPFVGVLPNGIDLKLWDKPVTAEDKIESKTMLYSHRPERGLINLVQKGGIMEQLLKIDPEIRLMVCGYDNTTQDTQQLYNYLYQRCEQLPNVLNVGHLSKEQLAEVQAKSWLHVYPTEFEETSCITMMEEQAAGTPILATRVGALTETLKNAGVYWTKMQKFVKSIQYLAANPDKWIQLHRKALEKAQSYNIETVCDNFLKMVELDFKNKTKNVHRLFKHLFYTSDIQAAILLAKKHKINTQCIEERFNTIEDDLGNTVKFYEKTEKRNTDLGNQHGMQAPSQLLQYGRMQPVINQLKQLEPDAYVLDYGCCVGQMSYALKTMFPDMRFHCVDISKEQTDVGKEYAEKNGIKGMFFNQCTDPSDLPENEYDAIICLEVLEHIWNYQHFLIKLSKRAVEGGKIILSTPLGPFDENSDDPDPLYQHLHNFEEQDIRDLVGKKDGFDMLYIGEAPSKAGEQLGNYVWMWTEDHKIDFGLIDYERKLQVQNPRETVTACIVCGPESPALEKTLRSIEHFVDQIIIGVDDPKWFSDPQTNIVGGLTHIVAAKHGATVFSIESPLKQGFAAARNATTKYANGDWILWIDDDETLVWGDILKRYIRGNMFSSYGIPQHHLSVDPVGHLKTDWPARLFRNNKGIKFHGIVHEHPETVINEGAGKFFIIPDKQGAIMHPAYDTEQTRRKRFIRNFPLMERDRQENPERKLGMYLWIRDLAHMNRFEYEQTGQVTPVMIKRAKEAVDLWRKTLTDSNVRMLRDSMAYITECVDITTQGGGLYFRMALDVNNKGIGDAVEAPVDVIFSGKVENKADLQALFDVLMVEKVDSVDSITYI